MSYLLGFGSVLQRGFDDVARHGRGFAFSSRKALQKSFPAVPKNGLQDFKVPRVYFGCQGRLASEKLASCPAGNCAPGYANI